MKVP
jgi:hypothetical protein